MKTNLQQGQKTGSGFEILEVKELAEFEALGIWAKHKSGAEVFHVLNDDSENLFSFNFATSPEDSCGTPHILEHSVLCGSENYPLKDAFLVLAQGSLETYLNAWTFPDKTLYPASSVNEHDYFNLMSVYGDAVFRPLLSEWTFMQEGHRFEYEADDKNNKSINITGVVYNEMKGAYSSADAYAGMWAYRSLFPETIYDFESGGDPDHIPELTLEKLREFHRSKYSPANCRVFLAGNIDTKKQLEFLNEHFFSSLPAGKAAEAVPKTAPWTDPRSFTISCPAGSETKNQVMLSWLCSDVNNPEETLALAALTEALLSHDGSPLTRSLMDSGLGEDLAPVTGFQVDLRETVFTAGLRGVDQGKEKEIEAFILKELKRIADEGIPKEEIEAALLGMEFSQKEIKRSGGPFSLVWLARSMRAWLHGGKPWDSLVFSPLFDELKKKLENDSRFFEKLIQKYFLENQHRAFIVVKPEKDFLEKKESLLKKQLAEKEKALSETEKENIRFKASELIKFQEKPEESEVLAKIPHLSRKDLSPETEKTPREFNEACGIPVLTHPVYTNGISYVDLAFPVDHLDNDDYFWLPFFSRVVISLGLPGMDYGEVSTLLARTCGAFVATLHSGSFVPGSTKISKFPSGNFDTGGRDWLIYHIKALDEKTVQSLDLVLRIITEADFLDLKRIKDLALEMKNDMDSNLAPLGHRDAESRAGRNFSRSRFINDMWCGLDQLYFVHRLVKMDTKEISERLVSIRNRLLEGGLLANLTGGVKIISKNIQALGNCFKGIGALKTQANNFEPYGYQKARAASHAEIFLSPSLQIGFAALCLPAADFGSTEQAAEAVFSHQLSTGPLWENIRMKGGAYGAFAYPDNLEKVFSFSSYRDPNPLKSLESFPQILKSLKKSALDAKTASNSDELEKAVIGSYSRETHPKTPAEKGTGDFMRFLYGIEEHHRSARLEKIINIGQKDINFVIERLAGENQECGSAIIAGRAEAEKAASALGAEIKELPI